MRLLLPAILVASLPCAAVAQDATDKPSTGKPATSAPAAVNALIGCWQGAKEPSMYVLFQADRLYLHQQGQTVMGTISYQAGAFDMGMMGQHALVPYTITGDALELSVGGQQVDFTRITTIPACITDATHPVVLGSAQPSAARTDTIKSELAKRLVEDQAVRTDPSKSKDMGKVDGDNTTYLRALVLDLGWIDVGRFGREASNAAFLIVQHSGDLPLMQAVLPEIEKDLKAKRLQDGQPYALLYDRLQLYQGKPQRYGSQIITNAKHELAVYKLEAPAEVDHRRAEIGMEPLSEYLKSFKASNGGKDVAIESE